MSRFWDTRWHAPNAFRGGFEQRDGPVATPGATVQSRLPGQVRAVRFARSR